METQQPENPDTEPTNRGGSVQSDFYRYVFKLGGTHEINPPNLQHEIDLHLRGYQKGDASSPSREGRIGPSFVCLDASSASGDVTLNNSDLDVDSVSQFPSIRANTCVFSGKWFFEVTVGTGGLQHIGWSTIKSAFTHEKGVGETSDSFAYDGKRAQKWNETRESYGQSWTSGDIIGCGIDLENGVIVYLRNGVSLNVAFRNIPRGHSFAYFPTISLQNGERSSFNFGQCPFQYPLSDFQPLQENPFPSLKASPNEVDYLIRSIDSIIRMPSMDEFEHESIDGEIQFCKAIIYERLAPYLFEKFTIINYFVPYMYELMLTRHKLSAKVENQGDIYHYCNDFLTDLHEHFEESTYDFCVATILTYLSAKTRAAFAIRESYQGPKAFIVLAIEIFYCRSALTSWINSENFFDDIEGFFSLKQPNSYDLEIAIPIVTCSTPNKEENEKDMDTSRTRLFTAVTSVEFFQLAMFEQLVKDDGKLSQRVHTNVISKSPRDAIMAWLRYLRKRNRHYNRQPHNANLSTPITLSSIYFMIIKFLSEQGFFAPENVEKFPLSMWLAPRFDMDMSRLSGQFISLAIAHEEQVTHMLSIDSHIAYDYELFSIALFIYQACVSLRSKNLLTMIQNQAQTLAQLEEAEIRIREMVDTIGNHQEILETYRTFRADVIEIVRHVCWNRVIYHNHEKVQIMLQSVSFLNQVILRASKSGFIYRFIPEMYMEGMLDAFHTLRRIDPVYLISHPDYLLRFVEFFVCHFRDDRISSVDMKDLMLQSIFILLQYPQYASMFCECEVVGESLMKSLLLAYDQHNWLSITNIILLFWKGHGFGERKSENDMSYFRELFVQACQSSQESVGSFLNRVFNNLNMCLTEFGVVLREISTAQNQQAPAFQQLIKRCSVLYEYSVNLLRLLEFISFSVPQAFLHEQEMNLTRLCELLVSTVNRVVIGREGALLEIARPLNKELESLSITDILASIIGIVSLLHKPNERMGSLPQTHGLTSWIMQDPSYSIGPFTTLLSLRWSATDGEESVDSLLNFSDFVQVLQNAGENQTNTHAHTNIRESAETKEPCPICYTGEPDTTFLPCRHSSCRRCITRHMVSSNKCFFCNAEISSLETQKVADE